MTMAPLGNYSVYLVDWVFVGIHHHWWWRLPAISTALHMEDIMDLQVGGQGQPVCQLPHLLHDGEGANALWLQFTTASQVDVFRREPHVVSYVELQVPSPAVICLLLGTLGTLHLGLHLRDNTIHSTCKVSSCGNITFRGEHFVNGQLHNTFGMVHHTKWGPTGCGTRVAIDREFHEKKVSHPVLPFSMDHSMQNLLQIAVHVFRLAIRLWMVAHGHQTAHPHMLEQGLPKGQSESGVPVMYYIIWEAVVLDYSHKKQVGNVGCRQVPFPHAAGQNTEQFC